MKITMLAVTVGLGLASAAPAFAGEANYEPFDNNRTILSTTTVPGRAYASAPDVGSAQYPNVIGRAGSRLTQLNNEVLPTNGSEGAVQTAASLPVGAEVGTVAYTQAQSIQRWMLAHNGSQAPRLAAR